MSIRTEPAPPRPAVPTDAPRGYGEAFTPTAYTGTAGITLPLPLLAACGAPELALSYAQGTQNGWFGAGFSISLPFISRRTETVPRYGPEDGFLGPEQQELTPALDPVGGEWVPVVSEIVDGGVTYRVQLFRARLDPLGERIERWEAPDGSFWWRVLDGAGGTAVFGRSPEARVADPADPARVLRWLAEEQADAHGNRVRYTWRAEDGAGWAGPLPDGWAERYPASIFYGNYTAGGGEAFGFELRFDYGEYDLESGSAVPVRPWPVRPDPILSCRGGFELLTLRLCRGVLAINHLPEVPGPLVARALALGYDLDPVLARITSATLTGFRLEGGATLRESVPPLGIEWAALDPEASTWRPMELAGGAPIPGVLEGGSYQMADLEGEGIPGLLYADQQSVLYCRPMGGGTYAAPEPLPAFPLAGTDTPYTALQDFDGSGRLSLVAMAPDGGGYFYNRGRGAWDGFRPFPSYAPEAASPAARWVDLDGDGRADLVVQLPGALRSYLNGGEAGFAPPVTTGALPGFPVLEGDERTLVTFADVLGDGMSHCVRVASGRVEVWPSLGYGRFAPPYAMEGAPVWGASLRPERVLLGAVGGSGRADLVLVYPDRLEVCLNLGGYAFAPPVVLPVPGGVSSVDQVTLADVRGVGRAAVVLSQAGNPVRHSFLELGPDGVFPYFAVRVANGMGASTRLAYRSSVDFYLADRARGTPWVTTVPFPVAVLERVEDADAVTGLVSTDVFQYAEGYYDAVEQTFRGFGFVQTQNTVTWGSGAWSFPAADGLPHAALREGARVERLWSYVGAFVDEPALMAAYRRRFFSGDPDAVPAGPSILLPPIRDEGGATVAEAARALSGAAMRREVYAVELSGDPAPVPFQVAEHSFTVEMVQPARGKNAGSFNVIPRQSVSSDYEQVADDPRVAQDATLAWDAYGRPTRTVQVAYPRRKPAVPAQGMMTCLLSDDHYAVPSDGSFLAGPVWRTREWEAAGMAPAHGSWFTYDDLAAQSAAAAAHPVDYGAPFTGGPQARLLTHDEAVFWNADQSAVLPEGECTERTLVHHNREAVFPEKWPAEVYGSRVDAAMLEEAGYYLRDGYWWRDDPTVRYWAEGFYQAKSFQTPFQAPAGCTTVEYDAPYWLVATRVADALGHAVTVAPDYQTLEPATITDENGVATEALYDPLGRVLVMSQHGTVQGQYRGGMQLANYERKPPPTLAELIADPGAYLQGARAFFHPLLAGWTGAGSQPASMAAVAAREDANQPDASAPTVPPAVSVTYLDGSGRTVEALQRVERAAAAELVGGTDEWVWLSGERVEYDAQDRVHRTYIPVYAESPVFAPAGDWPYTAFTYDALDREVREDTPKGFFARTERPDAWTEVSYDFDDTVLESRYYLEHAHDPDLPPAERRALEIAARFADTPATTRTGPQGFTVEEVEVNVDGGGNHVELANRYRVDARGLVAAAEDPRLGPAGIASVRTTYDMAQRVVRSVRADSGEVAFLPDVLDLPLHRWTARGTHVVTAYTSPVRRPLREDVDDAGTWKTAVALEYGTDASTLTVDRLVRVRDQSGESVTPLYGLAGEPAESTRRFAVQASGMVDWSDPAAVPLIPGEWREAWERDALGRIREERCADGSILRTTYWTPGWLATLSVEGTQGLAPVQVVSSAVYSAAGEVASAAHGNGVETEWEYDRLTEELVAIGSRAQDGALLQALAYAADPMGNVTTVEDGAAAALLGAPAQALKKEYDFDALYRLTSGKGWEAAQGAPWQEYEERFRYDDSGNLDRVEHAAAGSTETLEMAVATDSNRAVPAAMAAAGGRVDAFFDAAGNLTELEDGAALGYDFDNRLAQVSPGGGAPTALYRYDVEGRRLRRRVEGGGKVMDLLAVGPAFIQIDDNGGITSRWLLVRGLGQDLLLTPTGDSGGARYTLTDALGSVGVEVDDQGALLSYRDYYPYGGESLSTPPPGDAPPVELRFTGKPRDEETGLHYFGGRFYQSAWGRWLTPDPAGEVDGLNLYAYVGGNPVSRTDPSGFGRTTGVKKKTSVTTRVLRNRRRASLAGKAVTITGTMVTPATTAATTTTPLSVTSELTFGSTGSTFGAATYGGHVLKVAHGTGTFTVSAWWPKKGNTGKGISRNYPITNEHYRQDKKVSFIIQRKQRSMFKNGDKTKIGFVRGHRIPHADTVSNSPLSGGVISTTHKDDYYPEPEGWGEQQRKGREAKARKREMPVAQVEEYGPSPTVTANGTRVPDRLYFVEFTSLARDKTYAASKTYTAKAYSVDYRTFDYDSLPRAGKGKSDRRKTKPLRVTTLPSHVQEMALLKTGITGFTWKL